MPKSSLSLTAVPVGKLRGAERVPAAKPITVKFPKRSTAKAAATAAASRWRGAQAPPAKAARNPQVLIVAARPTRALFTTLRTIAESPAAPSKMLELRMGPIQLFGALYSGLTTLEFIRMEAEYRRRRTGTSAQIAAADAKWRRLVAEFGGVYARAGLRGVDEARLRSFARELRADSKNFNAVVKIANTAVTTAPPTPITSRVPLTAAFVEQTGVIKDLTNIVTPIVTICSTPLSQGSFTKHFGWSIALSVNVPYPCWHDWNPIPDICHKTVTLAGVSVALDMNVGYKVTCCGATVWGQVAGQACATIVGISVCASCTATVIGVAGVSRTPVASGCSYGLGINATLKCTLGGASILNMAYPFGWTIVGPCPPAGFCP
jgi:hypothetical protein